MPGGRQLFIIMSDREYQSCVYRISEPTSDIEDETKIRSLGRPVLVLDKSIFPELMSFAQMDSRIFMVGGFLSNNSTPKPVPSRDVFIYDTAYSTLVRGPSLNSGKINPYRFTSGSKLFVLSTLIYSSDRKTRSRKQKQKIQFEMLDTSDPVGGWCALPVPSLYVSDKDLKYEVYSVAAVSSMIFISLMDGGTYVFDIDTQLWDYASDEPKFLLK
ncbi:hypothetical protein RND81_14G022700 [Saponaria officinalis]|uniref:Uncharacterized protein n=1 Tax=Saponaria officinalis TaxID=3572 RepID=A0AAW1GPD4_SAPOF